MRSEYPLAAIAIVLWGTNPAVCKLSLGGMSSMQLIFLTSVIATVVLVGWGAAPGRLREARAYGPQDYLELAAIGIGPNFCCYLLTYQSLMVLPAHIATIINYLWPINTVLLAALILKERITLATIIALLLSFAGVAATMVALGGGSGLAPNQLTGVGFILAGSVLYGLFNVLNKRHGGSQVVNMIVYFSVSALAALPFVVDEGVPEIDTTSMFGALWVGILVNAAGYVLWCTALQSAPSAMLANMAYIAPVISLVVSYFLLGEHIAIGACAGLALIVGGFLLQAWLTRNYS